MATDKESKVVLRSSDGQEFMVEKTVAVKSKTIKTLLEEERGDGEIEMPVFPVYVVDGKTLAKILEYCQKHVDADQEKVSREELKKFDQEFVEVSLDDLYELIMASNYLNIEDLLDLVCEKVAMIIIGKTPEEIQRIINIQNDFTEEEEARIRSENAWAFE